MKNNKQKVYNARIVVDEKTGTVKITRAEQRTGVNQYRSNWKPATSRDLARLINRSKIVIK